MRAERISISVVLCAAGREEQIERSHGVCQKLMPAETISSNSQSTRTIEGSGLLRPNAVFETASPSLQSPIRSVSPASRQSLSVTERM